MWKTDLKWLAAVCRFIGLGIGLYKGLFYIDFVVDRVPGATIQVKDAADTYQLTYIFGLVTVAVLAVAGTIGWWSVALPQKLFALLIKFYFPPKGQVPWGKGIYSKKPYDDNGKTAQ